MGRHSAGSKRQQREDADTGGIPRVRTPGPGKGAAYGAPRRPGVRDTGPQAAVRDTGRQAAIRDTGRQAAIRDTGPQAAVRDTGRQAAVRDTGGHAAVRDTGQHATVRDTGRFPAYSGGSPQRVRGGHPQHTEGRPPPSWAGTVPSQRRPRWDYVAAFDEPGYGAGVARPRDDAWSDWPGEDPGGFFHRRGGLHDPVVPTPGMSGPPVKRRNKGRYATGIVAAAVAAALAAAIAGQMLGAGDRHEGARAEKPSRGGGDAASRSEPRAAPVPEPKAKPLSYAERMDRTYPLDPKLHGSGRFTTVPGTDKAPGKGKVLRYRVDIEAGLPLDGKLFAEAVQRTLNDKRSWGGRGARTFERVSSGRADFVISLASPGTTAKWCARDGLDTRVENVSCDAHSTSRIMINAYRWAQGAKTYGDAIRAYREMLINHEVGHRLGRGHVLCPKDGAPAPVMMQQTKFLTTNGATCKPNPWPYP